MKKISKTKIPKNKTIACSFQGGGALGAYQVGVLGALDEAGYYPDWFVGTSIGAINAAIAAGNPENLRIEKMHEFWRYITTPPCLDFPVFSEDVLSRRWKHFASSQVTLLAGQKGFFHPRFPSPDLGLYNNAVDLSYYDTSPLRSTLERFIDFDRINTNETTRISVGAVEICSGHIHYFDSFNEKITPDHIMASCALPPGFPAVEVEGELYWDGGISSNSPASYVLSNKCPKDLLCFTVHLFDSYGLNPTTMDEVLQRKKDIEFSSRLTKLIELYKEIHALKNSIHILSRYIPEDDKCNALLNSCLSKGRETTVALVRFLYEEDDTELSSKDYEFSHKSISERIASGYRVGRKAVKLSPWLNPIPRNEGIAVFDMSVKNHWSKEKENE